MRSIVSRVLLALRGLRRPAGGADALDASTTESFDVVIRALASTRPPAPPALAVSTSRRRLLSSLARIQGGEDLSRRIFGLRPGVVGAAVALFAFGAIGAGAAPGGNSPFSEVLDTMGIAQNDDNHGSHVSQAVHDAKTAYADPSATPEGSLGKAVSLAACMAAHDRETLPEGARNAPGQEDKEPKVCGTEEAEAEDEGGEGDAAVASATATPNHGQTVKKAVHDAIASTTPGPERGIAVSTAACEAAHDRGTLPEGAQKAPGKDGDGPKDCTHPNATETAAADAASTPEPTGGGNGNGKGNGPPAGKGKNQP